MTVSPFRQLQQVLSGLLTLLTAALTVSAAENQPPNVVLIFMDDMGYADIGPFGTQGYRTPHLDRLAKQGRVFTQFYAAQAVCSASRAALLTGCYPNRIGISGALGPSSRIGIHPDETTLAELVKQQGYATAIYGKWHLGHLPEFLPTRHGFDDYFGLPYSNDMWPHHPESAPGTWPDLPLIEGEQVVNPAVQPEDQKTLTRRYTIRAVDFIRRNATKPFFLYLAHSMPHVPLFASPRFEGKSGTGLFGDVMMEIDWSVGEIMAALDRFAIADNTWVIFTSDNGPWLSYGDHAGSAFPLREGKGTSWEGGVRVPCIMRWPGHIPAGTVCRDPLMTIDVLPTVAGRIGASLPARRIDGMDVWPLISGVPWATNPHRAYFFYYHRNDLEGMLTGDGRWKMVMPHAYRTLAGRAGGSGGKPVKYESAEAALELYDLSADISESVNVASQYPKIVSDLATIANEMRRDLGDSLTGTKPAGARPPGRVEEAR